MGTGPASSTALESKGLQRIVAGSTVGLAAGIVGLALPVTLYLLADYSPGTITFSAADLIKATAVLALAGAILFAISLMLYRWGFWSLQGVDRRFWTASVLCLVGMIGVVLIVLPMAVAFTASDSMANCIQNTPTKVLACLDSAAPLASYVALAGFWLIWIGGLGIVVGIGLISVRYREGYLGVGAGLYALLLLGIITPVLGLVFPLEGLVYSVLALPVLVLLAPALISYGSHRLFGSAEIDIPEAVHP
jgi:hypothetical protein